MPARTIAFSCLLLGVYGTAAAQTSYADSIRNASIHHATTTYLEYIGNQAPLYNGPVYRNQRASINNGSPFFKNAHPVAGSIHYNGILYEHIPLLFDVLGKKVLTPLPGSPETLVEIDLNKVSFFAVEESRFVRLPQSNDFLEVLHEDEKSSVYRLYRKEVKEDLSGQFTERNITEIKTVYVLKEGTLHKIANRNALMKVYADKRKELANFLQKEKYDMKKDPASATVAAARFYNNQP